MRAVALLDELFTAFDRAAASLALEKIRTVGDSYMAVAGAPEPRADHARAGLELARAILAAAAVWRARNMLDLQLRVGLASGPVVAGVIGQRRMLFDLWGETVNLAARMESSSLPGRIQVASSSWSLLRDRYRFVAREVGTQELAQTLAFVGPVLGAVPTTPSSAGGGAGPGMRK